MRAGGGHAELLILTAVGENRYACLVRPSRHLPPGSVVDIGPDLRARVDGAATGHAGARIVELLCGGDPAQAIERHGVVPLPPYIHDHLDDAERYQTVFSAGEPRSAAAPTAGLHFTERVLSRLRGRGVGWATVSLEVGLGTFAPMTEARIDDHVMHEEAFAIPTETAHRITEAQDGGGRVIAVGSTVVRTLETAATRDGSVRFGPGVTRLFIRPGHRFRAVDGMLTNFHQPGSSLLVMVAALAGPRWRAAYAHALEGPYRFLSCGDCMLIWGARGVAARPGGDGAPEG
jgi:S-adenosylmethionine:tRNA ribosyltransferase-isomerase